MAHDTEKIFCSNCKFKTNHYVRATHETSEGDGIVFFIKRALIVECCGCNHIAFIERSCFSEDEVHEINPETGEYVSVPIWKESMFPPASRRPTPEWLDDIPDDTLVRILKEIYQALEAGLSFLPTFGSRTLLDRLLVLIVGDQGSFKKGVDALLKEEKISINEGETLKLIIEAGHAAAHRGWSPDKAKIGTILDTVEALIKRLLVQPELIAELGDVVPQRGAVVTGDKVSLSAKSNLLTDENIEAITARKKLAVMNSKLRTVYDGLVDRLQSMGDTVTAHSKKHYIAFRRNRNFASIIISNQKGKLKLYLNLSPEELELDETHMRDVSAIGHYGTGNLEVTITTLDDIEKATPLISQSYEKS